MKIDGTACHTKLMRDIRPRLAFDRCADYAEWKEALKHKFRELLGFPLIESNAANGVPVVEKAEEKESYLKIDFLFESEKESWVPCCLLLPLHGGRVPLVITLQGHSTGYHNSFGEVRFAEDEEYIRTRGDFALQAVRCGYAALAIEQRGMGSRMASDPKQTWSKNCCNYTTYTAFLLGRTMIGERAFDVSKAIDAVQNLKMYSDKIDFSKIVCTGNSGGGTTSFYAACYDSRICLSAPSCAFCSYKESIGSIMHCGCNYIPSALQWFEMGDLATLIAPRKLLIFAGKNDTIFPLAGVEAAYSTAKSIYERENSVANCRLVITESDHYWCKDTIWREIGKELNGIDM